MNNVKLPNKPLTNSN